MPSVKIDSLTKEFSVPGGIEKAVDGISLEIEEGEFVSIVGPSGCGKTTSLRCLAGLETPTSGEISIDGHDIVEVPPNMRNIAMMFQNIALFPHQTIKENVAYPLKIRGISKKERYEKAKESAQVVQIEELLEKYPEEVSGGQQQRAALARTVVQDPQMFLMDEPLSDLDAKLKVEMRKEIQRIHKRLGKPTVYVTHDQEEAMTMSDRIVVMNDGQIEQIGTPDALYNTPVNRFVAEFIGNPTMNFIRGELLDHTDGAATIEYNGYEIEIKGYQSRPRENSTEVDIGFRPATVTLSQDEGLLSGELVLIERLGEDLLATIDTTDGEMTAIVSADHSLTEGETVTLSFDLTRAHLFDATDGSRLGVHKDTSGTPVESSTGVSEANR